MKYLPSKTTAIRLQSQSPHEYSTVNMRADSSPVVEPYSSVLCTYIIPPATERFRSYKIDLLKDVLLIKRCTFNSQRVSSPEPNHGNMERSIVGLAGRTTHPKFRCIPRSQRSTSPDPTDLHYSIVM
jgi:hypothetical protein